VGLAGHLKIGNQVTVTAKSRRHARHQGNGEKMAGHSRPAGPGKPKRQILAIQQLPELIRRVAELEKKKLEAKDQPEGWRRILSLMGLS